MKLKFDEITNVPREFSCENTGWCDTSGDKNALDIKAVCSVFRENKQTVILEGRLVGSFPTFCHRCGCDVVYEIDDEFYYRLTTEEEVLEELPEAEFDLDDLSTVYLDEPLVDVDELLAEQADLAMPMLVLCKDDCRGLCLRCGAKLTDKECQCDPGESNSPFAVLKKLSQS